MDRKCPGADNVRIPELEILHCPDCGGDVEFFTREKKSKCTECGKVMVKNEELSCLDWCPMAAECLGESPENKKTG